MKRLILVLIVLLFLLPHLYMQALTPVEVAEHRISKSPYEIAIGWDFKGVQQFEIPGDDSQVMLNWAPGNIWLDTFLHNHTCGGYSTFDYMDYLAARIIDPIHFIVVKECPLFTVHEFTRTQRTWPYVSAKEFNLLWAKTHDLNKVWQQLSVIHGFGYR